MATITQPVVVQADDADEYEQIKTYLDNQGMPESDPKRTDDDANLKITINYEAVRNDWS